MKTVIGIACVLLGAGTVYPGALEIQPVDPRADRSPVYSAWGGDKAAVPVAITGAPGTAYQLKGTLLQVAGGLAARIGGSLDLGAGELPASARKEAILEIPIPEVARPARFVIEVSVTPGAQGAPDSSFRAAIAAWPKVEDAKRGKPIVAALASAHLRLVVFGESESLRDYLKALQVDFEDAGAKLPERDPAGVVFLGDVPAKEMNDVADLRGRWIIVGDGAFPWPGIYRTVAAGADVTKICQPGFLRLHDDPAAATYFENLLIEVITSNATPIVP